MSTEPKWPSVEDAVAAFYNTGHSVGNTALTRQVIDMCRAAWLAANDDPSLSPVGEVRQSPDGVIAVRLDYAHATGTPWTTIAEVDGARGKYHGGVKGWPVIGAVPGSPAAEAQQ